MRCKHYIAYVECFLIEKRIAFGCLFDFILSYFFVSGTVELQPTAVLPICSIVIFFNIFGYFKLFACLLIRTIHLIIEYLNKRINRNYFFVFIKIIFTFFFFFNLFILNFILFSLNQFSDCNLAFHLGTFLCCFD